LFLRKIRVVVIDDSAYNRRAISKMLEDLPGIEVVGYAVDGEGIRTILDLKPDLVTLDIEMPRMDGFHPSSHHHEQVSTPVIVVSSLGGDDRVFKAMELGALDFIVKPTFGISDELLKIRESLHEKVRSVLKLNMAGIKMREALIGEGRPARNKRKASLSPFRGKSSGISVVAIGASTGGPPALQSILSAFNEQPPFAVVISQHMPAGFTRTFADRLNRLSVFDIKEAETGDLIKPGKVLIAPGGHSMIFQEMSGDVAARIVDPQPGEKYLPSVDRMFASCSDIFGARLRELSNRHGNDGSGGQGDKAAGGQVLPNRRNQRSFSGCLGRR
jgi:two-component system chemotaxis response regulator CheB